MYRRQIYITILMVLFLIGFQTRIAASAAIPEIKQNEKVDVEADCDSDTSDKESYLIKQVSLRDKFKRSPEAQINALIKKYNKYSMSSDLEKLKKLYTDSYVNNDGFKLDTIMDMMKMSSAVYKNVKYKTEIMKINISENYASVKVKEIATGETVKELSNISGTGNIVSEICYTDYLQKVNNEWKISATDVTYEKVSLKYGEAKYMDVDISAPDYIPAGSEYEVDVKTILPGGSFVVGSIVNEDIVYPQKNKKDVYKNIKSDSLARILKANTANHNEYATVSIAITRAKVDPPKVNIDMTGAAFIMKRVNVFSAQNQVKEKE